MRILLTAALLLMLVPAAHAQDDACSEADPCVWVVLVEEERLQAPEGDLRGTVGDWYMFDITYTGEDDPPGTDHTITYSGTGQSWTVSAGSEKAQSQPFELDEEGTFQLEDDVSGDTLTVTATFEDVADGDEGETDADQRRKTEEGDERSPFAPVAWVLLGLAAVALIARRR